MAKRSNKLKFTKEDILHVVIYGGLLFTTALVAYAANLEVVLSQHIDPVTATFIASIAIHAAKRFIIDHKQK